MLSYLPQGRILLVSDSLGIDGYCFDRNCTPEKCLSIDSLEGRYKDSDVSFSAPRLFRDLGKVSTDGSVFNRFTCVATSKERKPAILVVDFNDTLAIINPLDDNNLGACEGFAICSGPFQNEFTPFDCGLDPTKNFLEKTVLLYLSERGRLHMYLETGSMVMQPVIHTVDPVDISSRKRTGARRKVGWDDDDPRWGLLAFENMINITDKVHVCCEQWRE